jgi:hypothetical protein
MFFASHRNENSGCADDTFFSTIHQKIERPTDFMRIFEVLLINYITLFHFAIS